MPNNQGLIRIGYVVKRYPRYSETFVVNEILALEEAGVEIEIFALYPPVDTHFQDIISRLKSPVYYLPYSGIKAVDFWTACEQAGEAFPEVWQRLVKGRGEPALCVYQALVLSREIRLKNITHLHAHFATLPATVARLASYFSGITYSFTAHAKDIFHQSVNPDDLRRKLTDASSVVTVSDFNRKHLKHRYGLAASGVTRIYNGLDFAYFTYNLPRKKGNCIVAVGRLVEKKGFTDLIDACALLAARLEDFECFIIGTGPLERELGARIENSGLKPKVKLLGPKPQIEVRNCLKKADIFAAPCVIGADGNQDGLPMVILEAMALGVPCISTDVSGIPEVVRNNRTGLVIPQHNPKELSLAMERLLSDYELRVSLSKEARKLVEKEFDIHRNTACLLEIFYAAARGSRRPRRGKD